MLITSVVVYLVLRKLTTPVITEDVEESAAGSVSVSPEPADEGCYTAEQYVLLKRTGMCLILFAWNAVELWVIYSNIAIFCAMATLLFAATLRPSIPSAVYFIVFLLTATIWATYKEIDRGFAIICRVLCPLLIVHISALLAYQTPWPQQYLDVNNTIIR